MEKKKMEMKDMMHDVPGMVLRFMWEKYSRSKQTMSYVERCAKGDMILDGEKKKVFGGFQSLEHFLSRKRWTTTTGPRIQQEPAWDEKPIRTATPKNGTSTQKSVGRTLQQELKQPLVVGARKDGVLSSDGESILRVESTDWEDSELELERAVGVKEGVVEVVNCATVGANHVWEEFASSGWVAPNKLLYEKRCIGTREGRICDRKFVSLLSMKGNKANFNETEYRPTPGNPAWGCKTCKRAMCTPCKMNYVVNEKLQSPGRNSGVGNDREKRRYLTKEIEE
jgi:hypothetical protein